MKKFIGFFAFTLLVLASLTTAVSAGNLETNNFFAESTNVPLNNVQGIVVECNEFSCRSPSGSPFFNQNSGNSSSLVIEYPGTPQPTHYAEFLQSACYLPLAFNVEDFGTGLDVTFDNVFEKGQDCKAAIRSFTSADTVQINTPIVFNSVIDSAFKIDTTHVGFVLGNTSLYSSETEVTLRIFDSNGNLIHIETKAFDIADDTSISTSFSYTPTLQGSLTAQIETAITDCQCSNTVLQTASKIFTVVDGANNAPVLDPIGNKIVNENQSLQFTISGSDPDGDAITFSASNLPSGASFNPLTQTFLWTPGLNQAGIYFVTFTVSDGQLSDSETIQITVNDFAQNNPPVLDPIGSKTINEGQLLQFTVTGSDPDGDTITFGVSNLPAGASFNPLTQTFSWTPGSNQAGVYFVTFSVSDGQSSDSETIQITVNDVTLNNPPVLDPIGNKVVNENQLLQFTISGSDPDDDPLLFSVSNVPSGASFNPITKVFSWTPGFNQAGVYFVTFTVSDGQLMDSETIQITVNDVTLNNPPVLDPIGSKTINEGQSLQFTISGSDPDGDAITFSASNLPAGASFNPNTQTFFWTPNFNQAGTYFVTFAVSDGQLSDSETIVITVVDVPQNNPPVLDPIGDKTVFEGDLLSFKITASDPDNDPLTFSASNLPVGAVFNPNTQMFTWTPSFNQAGSHFVTFSVSDGQLSDSETIMIRVKNRNRPPILDPIGNKYVTEGELLRFTISGSDPDNDPITFSASNLPSGASFNPPTQTFSWTPGSNQAGVYFVTFSVSDGQLSDPETIMIRVKGVSNVPILRKLSPDIVNKDEHVTFTLTGLNFQPGAVVLFNGPASGLVNADFITSKTLKVTTLVNVPTGTYNIWVQNPDGQISNSLKLEVRRQTLTAEIVADKTSGEAPLKVNFDVAVRGGRGPYTYSWDLNNDGIFDSNDKTPIAKFDEFGVFTVVLRVTDSNGDKATDTITINVHRTTDRRNVVHINSIGFDKEYYKPGQEVFLFLNFQNEGNYELKNTRITAIIQELGVRSNTIKAANVGQEDESSKLLIVEIPEYAQPGRYWVEFVVDIDGDRRIKYRPIDII